MKKRVIFLFALLACICLSVSLAGCGEKEIPVAPAENGVITQYRSDWDGPHDVSVNIDGVLDEECWQNKNWYTTCAPGDSVGGSTWMKTTAFTTQFGVYMGVTVYDPNIVADSEFNIEASTCLEFFYTFRVDGKLYNTAYYQRGKFWLDAYGNYCTEGSRLKRAVTVDGVLGSGNTKSATFEIFIPWEQTGIKVTTDYPKEVFILPSCKIVFPGATQSTYTLGKVTGRDYFSYQAMYYEFDRNGYVKTDADGAVLGDAKNGFAKSANWNLDELDEGKLSVTAAYEYNWIFFRDAYAENFAAETFILPGDYFLDMDNGIVYDTNGLINYRDGHAGFYFLTDTGLEYVPRLSLNSMKEGTKDVLAEFNLSTLDNIISSHNASGSKAQMTNNGNSAGVKFKTVKYGADLLYFVNDTFLYAESVPSLNSKLYVGLYNITRSATYSDYSFTQYSAEQAEKAIADADICTVRTSSRTGGRIICNDKYVPKGGKTEIEVLCNSGYTLEKLTLNGEDITYDFKQNAVDGKYTVTVNEDANIAVAFARASAEQLAEVSGMVYSADRASAATLKFVSDSDASAAYSVNATSSRGYGVQLPKGEYTVYVTYGSTAGLARKLNVTESGTYDIRSYAYRNINMTYSVDEKSIIAQNPTSGPNYAMFVYEPSNEFVASAKFTAVQASFPAAGFTVEDEDGHSLQFQVIDNGTSTTFRLHVDMKWYDFKMEKGVSELFKEENGAKTCTVKLVSSNDMFAFYMNDKLVLGVTVDEINAYVNANIFKDVQTYFHKGKYSVGVFSWEVKAADNRNSSEPIVKVTDYGFVSDFAKGDTVNVKFSFFGNEETVTAKYGEGLTNVPSFGLYPVSDLPYDVLLNGAKVQLTEDMFAHLLCDGTVEYVLKNSVGFSYNAASKTLTNNAQSRFDIGTANGYFTANANITNHATYSCPGIIVEDAFGNKVMFGFADGGHARVMKSHSADWASSWIYSEPESNWVGGGGVNETYGLGLVYDDTGFSLWMNSSIACFYTSAQIEEMGLRLDGPLTVAIGTFDGDSVTFNSWSLTAA